MARRKITGDLEFRSDDRALDRTDKKLDSLTDSGRVTALSTSFNAVTKAVDILGDGIEKVGQLMMSILDTGREVERSRLTWEALLGTVDQVDARIRSLEKFASTAPFEFVNIEKAAIQLEAMGKFSERALKVAGDTSAIFGRDIGEAVEAMLSLARGELDTIERFGVTKINIAERMGKTTKELSMQTKEGLEEIWEGALLVMEDKFGGGMDRLATAFDGKLSMMQDKWFQAKKQMAGGGLTEGATSGLDLALDRMDKMLADGTFERIGDLLGAGLNLALGLAADLLGDTGTRLKLAGGRTGGALVKELLVDPSLSDVAERKRAVILAREIANELGATGKNRVESGILGGRAGTSDLKFFGKSLGKQVQLPTALTHLDRAMIGAIDAAALILYQTGDEEQARTLLRLATLDKLAGRSSSRTFPAFSGPTQEVAFSGPLSRDEYIAAVAGGGGGRGPLNLSGIPAVPGISRPFVRPTAGGVPGGGSTFYDPLAGPTFQPDFVEPFERNADRMAEIWGDTLDGMSTDFEDWSIKGKAIYSGMQGAIQGATAATSKIVEKFLLRENLSRLKGMDVVKFAAASGAASMLGAISTVAKQRAAFATAQGFEALGLIPGPVGAAASFKAAALWAVLGGVTAGAASAISTGAERDFAKATGERDQQFAAIGGAGGAGSVASSSAPGTRLVDAGAAPRDIHYHWQVTYQGGTLIFGEGGTREWYEQQIRPLIERDRELGELA